MSEILLMAPVAALTVYAVAPVTPVASKVLATVLEFVSAIVSTAVIAPIPVIPV